MARHPLETEERVNRMDDRIERARREPQGHLWERHHAVIRLYMMGMSQVDICKHTGFSQGFISALLNTPIAREQLAVMTASRDASAAGVAALLQEYAPKAAQHLMRVIDGKDENGNPVQVDPKLKVNVCQDWLSRSGFSPIQRGTFENINRRGIDDDTIAELKRRAVRNAQADAGFSLNNKENFTDAEIVDVGTDDNADGWSDEDQSGDAD